MTVVGDLAAAIAADPDDEAPQLVIADLLQAEGDPRGELIALDRAERAGELTDPEALEKLLLLAAEYSFPRASNVEEPMLELVREGDTYVTSHRGSRYVIGNGGGVTVWVYRDDELVDSHRWDLYFSLETPEAQPFFALLGDAIRAATPLDDLVFPQGPLPLPIYDGGPARCYRLPMDFLARHGLLRNRYGLAARDYHRWNGIWRRVRSLIAPGR